MLNNRICNGVHSTWPNLAKSNQLATELMSTIPPPAKSIQLATKLMSTIAPPAEVRKEEELGEKAPAAFEPHQTLGRSTRSSARKRCGAPTNPPSSSPRTAVDSPNLSMRDPTAKKSQTSASRR
ncbi:unnamed protein product [Dibothriocephalus latus]|uniref:Uncharacterized protein n=1 Tax=Dibothriocephalus latus TaxID=60516 RepID=A0A3P7NLM8_DIBLA|nr:unnamed protein product [Dibothriocephalus latus]